MEDTMSTDRTDQHGSTARRGTAVSPTTEVAQHTAGVTEERNKLLDTQAGVGSTEPEIEYVNLLSPHFTLGQATVRQAVELRGTEFLLQFFEYYHLPENLQVVSKPFAELAHRMVNTLPRNAERTTALRKLLEAKDCAVRAMVAK